MYATLIIPIFYINITEHLLFSYNMPNLEGMLKEYMTTVDEDIQKLQSWGLLLTSSSTTTTMTASTVDTVFTNVANMSLTDAVPSASVTVTVDANKESVQQSGTVVYCTVVYFTVVYCTVLYCYYFQSTKYSSIYLSIIYYYYIF